MAELNFNALARPGPQGFMQGYEQGQQQRMVQETNQIAQDTSRFKLDELKQDREEMLQLQAQLKSLGQDPNPRTFLQTLKNTGRPEYVKMAIEGMQKLDDLDAYANLGKGGAMPTGAPAVSSNRVNELNAAPGVEVFKVNEQPAPVNALASPAAAAMPVNALAPQPNADQIAPTQQRIRQLLDFARSNPRMASQAMSEARILQDQLELFSKRGQNEPADAVMMQRLGYPPTQEGFKAYQDAKRAERPDLLLNPEVEAQRIRMALASRPPAPPRAEAAPRTQQVTLNDGSLGIVNMDTGVITRSTVDGASVKGKPSAFAEKATAQKAQMGKDLNFAIAQLTDITKDGGLIDQSTGSGAGRLVDIGAGFVGQATKGAIAIGKIAPVADLALKMIPRFEGPQSNADTKSYKEAAGQLADPTLPTEIRKQAGRAVLRIMKERQGQFVTSDMAAEGATAANPTQNVRSEADAILNGSK